ncbi:MAG TPA: DUF2231 domain-containing protein [Chitinophagaceae bacterium]
MRLFGHPIHPILIHFPTALLPMELLFSFLHRIYNYEAYWIAAFYCLVVGVFAGLAAILTGLVDLTSISKDNKPAIATALYHGFLNGGIILIYGIVLYKAWQLFPDPDIPGPGALIFRAALIILLFGGNYLGGALIYKYHVGINKRDSNANN